MSDHLRAQWRQAAAKSAGIYHPWDGQQEEGTLPRPAKKYPWVYVIQHEIEGDAQSRYVWGVYPPHRSTTAQAQGVADTVEEAREAARAAAAVLT